MNAPLRPAARRREGRDLAACWLGALVLHGAVLAWAPAELPGRPALVAPRSGNISVEVSLASDSPSPRDVFAEPDIQVREPEPPERPREIEPPLPPEEPVEVVEPEIPILAVDAPLTPREMARPPEEPAPTPSVAAGRTGNRTAGVERHYIHHPDEGRPRVREATAVLRIRVLASGRVESVEVLRSSGHADLDRAAVRGLSNARCRPATFGGKPVDSWLERAVHFRERDAATSN